MKRALRKAADPARIVSPDLHIRPAEAADAEDVWRWRNDPETRAASRTTEPVPWPAHAAWFAETLCEPARMLLIGVDPETREKVGLVRFDTLDGGDRLVGINIAPERRGRGYGARLLAGAVAQLRGACRLVAEVRRENAASMRLFEALGFRRRSEAAGFIVFERAQEG